ncbi:MAG TPA: 5'-nucleotidase C-terminal domain-containing protein [Bacteroidia bacterium]|nr:5'-nucleotidase C-terminal domain-containing protein [Bacteroidia bacterium]
MYKNFKLPIKLGFASALLLLLSCSKHLYVQQTTPQHFVVNNNEVDSQIVKTIQPYKQSLDGKMHEVIGTTPISLTKKTPESTLGNFFAEAIFDRVKHLPNIDTVNTFAMFNNGGLRTSVPQGNIMVGSMYELMPFENKLVVVKISSDRLLKLLNFIIEKDGAPVAGIRFVIADKKPTNIEINGKSFDANITYYVATSDYLAGGGDKFFSADENNSTVKTDFLLRDILIDYCRNLSKQNKPVTANLDGRIQYAK